MTGKDYSPNSDSSKSKKPTKDEKKDNQNKGNKDSKMAPTISTAGLSPEAENLLKKVSEQGDVVRNLKTSAAPKVIEFGCFY